MSDYMIEKISACKAEISCLTDWIYRLKYKGAPIGIAGYYPVMGGWMWTTQRPGRKPGRKAWDNPVDCIASGSGVRKGLIRKLVEAA